MPIQAYLDWRRFGVLPRAGGTFDQPDELLDDMRTVAEIVEEAERKRAENERKQAGKGRVKRRRS